MHIIEVKERISDRVCDNHLLSWLAEHRKALLGATSLVFLEYGPPGIPHPGV